MFVVDDFAACAALEAVELVVALVVLAVLEVEALLEAEFSVSADCVPLLALFVAVLAALLVAFVDDELPDALVLLAALPLDDDVLPPLEPLLVNVELPVVAADPPVADVAEFAVEPWLDVLLLVLASVDESLDVSAADFT